MVIFDIEGRTNNNQSLWKWEELPASVYTDRSCSNNLENFSLSWTQTKILYSESVNWTNNNSRPFYIRNAININIPNHLYRKGVAVYIKYNEVIKLIELFSRHIYVVYNVVSRAWKIYDAESRVLQMKISSNDIIIRTVYKYWLII
jgi:hypothetical protein